jgi:acyl-coenzyme A thioesterase PaaI-like protein
MSIADFARSARLLRHGLNLYPPLLFAGIRVEELSPDFRRARVRLAHWRATRNYVGTQFGGSLFAMTDPFWMMMVMRNLGDDYIVWDRAAEIDFIAPARSAVTCEFVLEPEVLDDLRRQAAGGRKVLRWFDCIVTDSSGQVVTRVRKQLYVRLKRSRAVAEVAGRRSTPAAS